MARQLVRHKTRSGRVCRQVAQHRFSLFFPALAITATQHSACARFVPRCIKNKTVFIRRQWVVANAPAGERACQFGDVGLAVAAVDAQGVQLQGFTRQVLIQTLVPALANAGIGTQGLLVV